MTLIPGNKASSAGRTVDAPSNMVSMTPAQVQQAVGEDVAPVQVGGQLNLVDGQEGDVGVRRHGLDGADAKPCAGGQDLFLARDKRDILNTHLCHYAAIDLAGQQTQRQPDHAGGLSDHPLDGHVGLARVGGPQHGGHAPARQHVGRPTIGAQFRMGVKVHDVPVADQRVRPSAASRRTLTVYKRARTGVGRITHIWERIGTVREQTVAESVLIRCWPFVPYQIRCGSGVQVTSWMGSNRVEVLLSDRWKGGCAVSEQFYTYVTTILKTIVNKGFRTCPIGDVLSST